MQNGYDNGPYVTGHGTGNANGPRSDALWKKWYKPPMKGCPVWVYSTTVDLEYGKPVIDEFMPFRLIKPIEKAFEMLRYHDPSERNNIYIVRYNPAKIIWGQFQNPVTVSATPKLHKVFDEYLPRYKRESKLFFRREGIEFKKAMARAGLTEKDIPKSPADDASQEILGLYRAEYSKFFRKVSEHARIPKLGLVKVDGVDDILDKIPITETGESLFDKLKKDPQYQAIELKL